MVQASSSSPDQAAHWNGPAGEAWVEAQELLDGMFSGLEEALADTAATASARRVLDIGCGTGATTLAVARRLGEDGEALGVDISAPMVTHARARAEREGSQARFVVADATTHALPPAHFDLAVSRFGVMFFPDPVAAFANIRRALRPGGGLAAVAWRSRDENPFMTTAERTAVPMLPEAPPPRRPDAPGQFAFADESRVRGILEDSGWGGVTMRPVDVDCTFPATALELYLTRLGPLGTLLREVDEVTRERVLTAVRAAFQTFVHGDTVRFTAACWWIEARA
ncbi:class I SAM-dependent methyltransferase [Pseudoxanthobacter sp. M-2]|uniref:class I SAM-dependent methyltransferase n=1 Tax=Pseudoxanthobacter sp. M-2 TaxID=3078754 RepID=UPI0038FCEB7F